MTESMEHRAASMKIKSYFSGSVEKAIQAARQEMGPDAVLLTTRRSAPEALHLGAYEVVFGTAPSGSVSGGPSSLDLNTELHNLQLQMAELKSALQFGRPGREVTANSLPEELSRELVEAGFERELAWLIAEEAVEAWRNAPIAPTSIRPASLLRQCAVDAISKRLRFADTSPTGLQEGNRIIVFVGPPGAGKTAALVKFAVQNCVAAQQTARVISLDPVRVAAHEKLRALAAVIGIGFTAVSTVTEFLAAIEEFRGKNIILVDTPGFGSREFETAAEVSACLARVNRRETHLVLPATMKRGDLSRCVHQYSVFQPDFLLFTKIDETESYGALVSVAIETAKPISLLANGQSIPEDLIRATSEALTAFLTVREPAGATSAA